MLDGPATASNGSRAERAARPLAVRPPPGGSVPAWPGVPTLTGARHQQAAVFVVPAEGREALDAYRTLRRRTFVEEQGLFAASDHDDVDDHPDTVVLVARAADDPAAVIGGVRIAPAVPGEDLAWWIGSRLVVEPGHRGAASVGGALVRAACETAERLGALRFEADVQVERRRFFTTLGWEVVGQVERAGAPHLRVRWPIDRLARQAGTKRDLGRLLDGLAPGGAGWVGDDAAPVPGRAGLVAACDAIVPAMVERDPWWAGWCSVLVNVNDVTVKGARPVGLLDAIGSPTASHARRVLAGLRAAADAWGVPVLGGHTTLGTHASLAVTVLGQAAETSGPVPGGTGRVGDALTVAADLGGGWRPGYHARQWDSTTKRTPRELQAMADLVARWRPAAAKDVSMAGLVGTIGMLAEASGCGAELRVADVPRPASLASGPGADHVGSLADWLCCFPGFALVLADRPGRPAPVPHRTPVTSSRCGTLTESTGVRLVWPDDVSLDVLDGAVTGLGPAA